ncbi:MAG: chemotaxis protein CheA [Lachnospiraceae bacterium]|nr:chemotaxis protein CheA [Candidatus Colinaster scatohippi]
MAAEFNTDGMLDMYLFENTQLLERLQEIVLEQKDADGFDSDGINEIFRAMHTIKGSSGVMMFDEITAVAHKLEDIFYYLRESHPDNVPHIKLVEHVLEVADFIQGEMDKLSDGEDADGNAQEIIKGLDDFLSSIKGEKNDKKKEAAVENKADDGPKQFYIAPMASGTSHYYQIYITYMQDVDMANVHAYKAVYALKDIAEDLLYQPDDIITDPETASEILENGFKILLQTQKSEADVRKIIGEGYEIQAVEIFEVTAAQYQRGFDIFGTDIEIDLESSVEEIEAKAEGGIILEAPAVKKQEEKKEIAPGDFVIQTKEPGKGKKLAKDKAKKAEKTSYISVDVAKMDQLMDLIGELVISESVVLQNPDLKVPGLRLDNFNKAAGQMSKISTDLQNVIMSMRMVPLTNTFQKMNRIVFDVSRKLGKEVEFEMVGDTTEVDKNIIEHISDPLMHLVRNSVDHGIEMPDERAAAGKKDKGKITLFAKTEAGKVWIGVQDNGAGLDRKKILEKARKQELLDPTRKDSSYPDKDVWQFITLPGFSTNEKVTEYSGRGVGMDVVVQNIQEIGGSLEIESKQGEGSLMLLKIPLTLAIIDGIVMKAGNSCFVIQTDVVKEFVGVDESMMVKQPNGEECVMIRGECYPVMRLGEWYHLEDYECNINDGMMLILEIEGRRVCMFVDKLIGKQEIVVKPIPAYVKKVRGLSGCTQLGDGGIALILDPAGLVE